MNVILMGVNADIKCIDCPIKDFGDDCLMQKYSSDTWEEMKEDCPMKSVEGLIEEINRKANSGQWSDATVYGMRKAIAIIKEYCEVE